MNIRIAGDLPDRVYFVCLEEVIVLLGQQHRAWKQGTVSSFSPLALLLWMRPSG